MSELPQSVAEHFRALVHWAADLRSQAQPPQVARKAALVLADDLAAMIGACGEPEVAAFHDFTQARSSRAEATIFRGGRPRVDRISAAVANALAADWLELDEGYRKVSCHAGIYVLPALLAEAEAADLSVRDVLRNAALAYEVVARIACAFISKDEAIHSHAHYAAIGACAATAGARALDAEEFLSALGAACTFSFAGPRSHVVKGALVRNTWPAVGAWCGMMSVEWARCGIGGLAESAYDALAVALHADSHPRLLTEDLGKVWAITEGYSKIHACCQHAHSAVEAALELRGQLPSGATLGGIDEVMVETHRLALRLSNPLPPTTLAAKFSMQHIIAATLKYGEAGARAFYSDTLADTDIAVLRDKVKISAYTPALAPPNDRPARVRVSLADGSTLTSECLSAAGGPDRPFGEDVVIDKIRRLTSGVYPRFVPVMQSIIALDEAQLERKWSEVVAEFCGSPSR